MPAVARPLLERACDLAALTAAAGAVAHGRGSVALVAGEAGIGKSSLVAALRDTLPAELRMLAGYCDDLTTPRTLGPIRDLAGSVGPELTTALRAGADRDAVLAALHAELRTPTVLVIEDVHWADDATLDVLRYLIRRVSGLPALLVLTYRDDAVSREHPVQHMLGQAAVAERVHRLRARAAVPHRRFAVERGQPGRRRAAARGDGRQPVLRARGAGARPGLRRPADGRRRRAVPGAPARAGRSRGAGTARGHTVHSGALVGRRPAARRRPGSGRRRAARAASPCRPPGSPSGTSCPAAPSPTRCPARGGWSSTGSRSPRCSRAPSRTCPG